MAAAFHAYYIPAQRAVHGTSDPDVVAHLYAAYMRRLDPAAEPDRFDGTSLVLSVDPETLVASAWRLETVQRRPSRVNL